MPFCAGDREHVLAGALVHHVEAHHEDLPDVILHGELEHLVGVILDRVLGDADVPDLALGLLLQQRGHDLLDRVLVLVRVHAVQIEHVDGVGAHQAQRVVQAGDHLLRRPPLAAAMHECLGGDHDRLAGNRLERLSDHALGAVGGGGVDEVDAEVHGLVDEPGAFILGFAGLHAQPAETAGAQAGHADLEAGPAQRCVFHTALSIRPAARPAALDQWTWSSHLVAGRNQGDCCLP